MPMLGPFRTLSLYWKILGQHQSVARNCVLKSILGGLSEALALVIIVQIIQIRSGTINLPPKLTPFLAGFSTPQILTAGLGVFLALALGSTLLRYRSSVGLSRMHAVIEHELRNRLIGEILRVRWEDLLSFRLSSASKAVLMDGWQTAKGINQLVNATSQVCIAGILMFAAGLVAPELIPLVILLGVTVGIAYVPLAKRSSKWARAFADCNNEVSNNTAEFISGIKYIRSSGSQSRAGLSLNQRFSHFAKAAHQTVRSQDQSRLLLEVSGICFITLLFALSSGVNPGLVGRGIAFIGLYYRAIPRLLTGHTHYSIAKEMQGWAESWLYLYESLVALPGSYLETPLNKSENLFTYDKRLSLQEVSFTYPGSETPALNSLSFNLDFGEVVAVTGASGSGKTTLVDILTGLIKPTTGIITIDAKPITFSNQSAWQSKIGLVLQSPCLIYGSVANNITHSHPNPDIERVKTCLIAADAWEFVKSMPDGLETIIGESGSGFSGGQLQRLALARALYLQPRLLILDEATSALDLESEKRIVAALAKLKKSLSILIVTHRTAPLALADRIISLNKD